MTENTKNPATSAQPPPDEDAPRRILIVDDDPSAIQVLAAAVDKAGETSFAMSAEEAIRLLGHQSFDLVLLDAQMPGMDGYQACRIIHDEFPEVPVVFVTSSADVDSEVRALESGAVDFIPKPIHPVVVRARIGSQLKLKAQADRLRALTFSDALTRIANRRMFDEQLRNEWARAERHRSEIAMMLIDIDEFKGYNDQYGHVAGDGCLQQVAKAIADCSNQTGELAARYGGEEFAVLMPHADLEQAMNKGRRIVEQVSALGIEHGRSSVRPHVTVSIGVGAGVPARNGGADARERAEGDEGPRTPVELIEWADSALYLAKLGGRNQVRAHERGIAANSWLLSV